MRRLSLAVVASLALGCTNDNLQPIARDYYALQSVAGVLLPAL